ASSRRGSPRLGVPGATRAAGDRQAGLYSNAARTKGTSDMSVLISWLVLSVAVWITAAVLPGFHIKSIGSAVLVAAIFGVLNFLLGWLLFAVFAIATLGIAWLLAFITRWIINAIL